MKPKISKFILFLAYNFSFVFLNSCQQKPNNQDIDQDLKKMKQNLDTLMKELNVKTFKELHNLLIKYKKNNIKISNDLLDALHVKDLDSAITVVSNLIMKQNNSKKAHILSCFMFDANGIISYDSLLNKFDDEVWKKEYENEIMLLCDKLGIEKNKLNSNLQIDKEIINLAKSYAQDMLPSFQKVIQKAKDAFFQELQTQCEKQNQQVFLLTQFLLEKNALEFSDDLKKQFAKTWISNHPQETCAAFGLDKIDSFDQNMLTQNIIEKAQNSAKQVFSFCQKELQTQCEKQNKQVFLLTQFLLEKNALEFSDDLKKQFAKTWISNHPQETCAAFGLDKIDSFDQNMLMQNIIEKAQNSAKQAFSFCQKELQTQCEKQNQQVFLLTQFLLEKNALEFSDDLKKQFAKTWISNHSQETCAAFGLDKIDSFDQNMLTQNIIEKAQNSAKQVFSFCQKELQTQCEKQNKQVFLLTQFLLEKNALEFSDDLKKQFAKTWISNHPQETCAAFGLDKIDSFDQNMLMQNIIEKAQNSAKQAFSFYQKELQTQCEKQNQQVFLLTQFLLEKNALEFSADLKNQFATSWISNHPQETCAAFGLDKIDSFDQNMLTQNIIEKAQNSAKQVFSFCQKELQTQCEKQNKQVFLLTQFLLEKNALEFSDDLKKQFAKTWISNHSQETCAAFGLDKIDSFDQNMLTQNIIEKAQNSAKQAFSFCQKELQTQCEKQNQQVFLLTQFLLEKNALEFSDDLKKQFAKTWISNHSQETCAAFGLDKIDSFDQNMLTQNIIEKAQNSAKQVFSFCQKELQTQCEKQNKQVFLLTQFLLEKNALEFSDDLKKQFAKTWISNHPQETCAAFGLDKIDSFDQNMLMQNIIEKAQNSAKQAFSFCQKELQTQCEKQNKQVFLLTQFLLEKNALEFSADLKNQFATTWISNHPQETCAAFGLDKIDSFDQNMLTQNIIEKAQNSAKQAFSFCQKELQTQCEKQNQQVFLLTQFLLEKNALEFSAELKKQFATTWISNHPQETCAAFGLDKIDSFDQNMLTQNIIEKAQNSAKQAFSFCQKELQTQCEKQNKQVFLLTQFLLEKNALEFSADLKNQFATTWISNHPQETCAAFGLDKIDSFDQNMLTQNIIDSVHHLMKVYYSSYQNMLNEKVKEINNKELFILKEFEHDFENLSKNRRETLLKIIRSLIVIASADQQQSDYDTFLDGIRTEIKDFIIKSSYLKGWDETWKGDNDEIYNEYTNEGSIKTS